MRARTNRLLGGAGAVLIVGGVILYGILYTSGWVALLPLLAGIALAIVSLAAGYRGAEHPGIRRSMRYGLGTGLSVIVMAAILLFLQTLSHRNNTRFDLTRNRRFSLAPQTVKLLEGLEIDVKITAFYKQASQERLLMQDLLSAYRDRSARVEYLFIDPDGDPVIARRFNVKSAGVVFFESEGRTEMLEQPSEERITNAIARIARGESRRICFLTGHGEHQVEETGSHGYSELREALELENFEVREFLALEADSIPAACDIVVVAGPERDILKREQSMLFDYLAAGGRALFMLDPMTEIRNIEGILSRFGIAVGGDIIVDRYGQLIAGNYLTPVVNRYGPHPITEGFRHFTFFPQARSLSLAAAMPPGISATAICITNDEAYAETDLATLLEGRSQFDPAEDRKGPIELAAAAEIRLRASAAADTSARGGGEAASSPVHSRIVVFGDSDFAVNTNLRLAGNRDLIMNAVNWLAETDDLISIRPVDSFHQPVLLSATQGRFIFWISVVGLPALVAAVGFAAVARKRLGE